MKVQVAWAWIVPCVSGRGDKSTVSVSVDCRMKVQVAWAWIVPCVSGRGDNSAVSR